MSYEKELNAVREAIDKLIEEAACPTLEEALDRLEEVQMDVDTRIEGIYADLARKGDH